MPYGTLVRCTGIKAQEVTAMAIITAAIGGKKANKLISLLDSRQMVGLLADVFPDETQLVNIFNALR